MKKNLKNEGAQERKLIANCVFQGFTITQIARKLNYSPSTVSNRLSELFKAYNASSRCEFVAKSFGQLLKNKSMLLKEKEREIEKLSDRIKHLETLLEIKTKKI